MHTLHSAYKVPMYTEYLSKLNRNKIAQKMYEHKTLWTTTTHRQQTWKIVKLFKFCKLYFWSTLQEKSAYHKVKRVYPSTSTAYNRPRIYSSMDSSTNFLKLCQQYYERPTSSRIATISDICSWSMFDRWKASLWRLRATLQRLANRHIIIY